MEPNDELRRILEAGPPKDGNQEHLWRALFEARLHVAMAFRAWSFFAMGNNDDRGHHTAAYTHRELAPDELAKWRIKWVTCGIREIAEHALALGSKSLRINPGHYGYELSYEAMTAAASNVGYGAGGALVMFDVVQSWEGKLASEPPRNVLERWRKSARKHGVVGARMSGLRIGKMPMAACIAYAPPRNERFEKECHQALQDVFLQSRLVFRHDRSFAPEASIPISEEFR